jgi:hypothetical protein
MSSFPVIRTADRYGLSISIDVISTRLASRLRRLGTIFTCSALKRPRRRPAFGSADGEANQIYRRPADVQLLNFAAYPECFDNFTLEPVDSQTKSEHSCNQKGNDSGCDTHAPAFDPEAAQRI